MIKNIILISLFSFCHTQGNNNSSIWLMSISRQDIKYFSGMLLIIKVNQFQQEFIYIQLKPKGTRKQKKWYF